MALKDYNVTFPATEERVIKVTASNKKAAANRASRELREAYKNVEPATVARVKDGAEVEDNESEE